MSHRQDIPSYLIGKNVILSNLKTKELNGKTGFVVGWNYEIDRFIVDLCDYEDQSKRKLIKPYNANYYPIFKTEEENELHKIILDKKLINFEQGMERFENLGPIEEYRITNLKLQWLQFLLFTRALYDKRYVPKIQNVLIEIMETSKFSDLIVTSKLLFCETYRFGIKREEFNEFDLCSPCINEHYGKLPKLFLIMCDTPPQDCNELNYMYALFQRSTKMLLNRTCEVVDVNSFVTKCAKYFHIFENCFFGEPFDGLAIQSQASVLHEITHKLLTPFGNYASTHGWINFWENRFEEALKNTELSEQDGCMIHILQIECYFNLNNKKMARKSLKNLIVQAKLKKGCNLIKIDEYKDLVENMEDLEENDSETEEFEEMRIKCNAIQCKRLELYSGEFKACGKCGIKYCSKNCQKKDWKRHKTQCLKK